MIESIENNRLILDTVYDGEVILLDPDTETYQHWIESDGAAEHMIEIEGMLYEYYQDL